MKNYPASLDSYFAAWNARDRHSIRKHLADAFGENTRYLDPKRSTTGIEEFADCLADFREQAPHADIALASGVDAHHNILRYAWELRAGPRTLTGYDVLELDRTQRIVSVLSFFGPLPLLPPAESGL